MLHNQLQCDRLAPQTKQTLVWTKKTSVKALTHSQGLVRGALILFSIIIQHQNYEMKADTHPEQEESSFK